MLSWACVDWYHGLSCVVRPSTQDTINLNKRVYISHSCGTFHFAWNNNWLSIMEYTARWRFCTKRVTSAGPWEVSRTLPELSLSFDVVVVVVQISPPSNDPALVARV